MLLYVHVKYARTETVLFKRVEGRVKGTVFTSVSSYVTYVLREIVAKEEEERVKAGLRALGYI